MKKVALILLCFLFFIQFGGMLIIKKMEQQAARERIQKTLRNKNSKLVALSLDLYEYERALVMPRELLYKGKIYDIKSEKFSLEKGIIQKSLEFT